MNDLRQNIMPVEFSDPFYKEKIIAINVYEGLNFVGAWGATGYIIFKDKMTEGRQDFEGKSFNEVVLKMKEFLSKMR